MSFLKIRKASESFLVEKDIAYLHFPFVEEPRNSRMENISDKPSVVPLL